MGVDCERHMVGRNSWAVTKQFYNKCELRTRLGFPNIHIIRFFRTDLSFSRAHPSLARAVRLSRGLGIWKNSTQTRGESRRNDGQWESETLATASLPEGWTRPGSTWNVPPCLTKH